MPPTTQQYIDKDALVAALQGLGAGRKDLLVANPGDRIYGNQLFGLCGDSDIMSALVRDEGFLNWIQWTANNEVIRLVKMLTWVGPEGTAAHTVTAGWLTDKCAPPNSVEWGKCEIQFEKGILGRCGQDIAAIDLGMKYCDKEDMLRLDGTPITDDAEWQLMLAGWVLRDDISEMLIVGNKNTPYQFDGLEQLVVTGYSDVRNGNLCSQVDSIVVDWGFAGVSGLPSMLAEIIARIKLRAKAAGGINVSRDVTIMLPAFLRNCLVDAYACEGPCASNGVTVTVIQADARGSRDQYLTGGNNGDGYIPINGEMVSFLVNDWIPFGSCEGGAGYASDIYILTKQIGPRTVMRGEYQDLSTSANGLARYFGSNRFQVVQGGRFLLYGRLDEACFNTCLLTRLGLYMSAPWAQARITDVCCSSNLVPLSPDPDSEYFLNYADLYVARTPDESAADALLV